jgi:hypothetical protein
VKHGEVAKLARECDFCVHAHLCVLYIVISPAQSATVCLHDPSAHLIWPPPAGQAWTAPVVNTHAFSAPVTPPAVLAVVQAVADNVAAAQLALVPPALTAQVAVGVGAVSADCLHSPASHLP